MSPRSYRLLHVTDQHFSCSHFWTRRSDPEFSPQKAEDVARKHFQELLKALWQREATRPPFDAVILSGDFTDQHLAHGFDIAKLWVRLLVDKGFAPADNILLVPGNHDVDLGKTVGNSKTCLPVPRGVAEGAYREFLERLESPFDKAALDLSIAIRISRGDPAPGLILVGLNSCRSERMDSQGWGYVGLDQLNSLMLRMYNMKQGFIPRENDILIAFTHHNPLPVWDVGLPELSRPAENRKVSFLMDAASLLEALNAFGFGALLHGHTHRSKTARLEGYDPRPENITRSLIVSGQGSFSANLTDCKRHHFAVAEIRLDGRTLALSHFYAERQTYGAERWWEVFPEEGSETWSLHDPGWRRKNVVEALRLYANEAGIAHDKWTMMESWASLYHRPQNSKKRSASIVWGAVLEGIAWHVGRILQKDIPVEAVAAVIEDIFKTKHALGETSSLYLNQYIAWMLRKGK
jgi:Calcineurin-like phosphoesterase